MKDHVIKMIPTGYLGYFSRLTIGNFPLVDKLSIFLSALNRKTLNHSALNAVAQPNQFSSKKAKKDTLLKGLPPIKVHAPIIAKDFHLVRFFLQNLILYSQNKISEISFITTRKDFLELQTLVENYPLVKVVVEDEVVSKPIFDILGELNPPFRGWVLQMAIKFTSVLQSDSEFNLVIDPDTVLTSPTTWVTHDGISALFPTYHNSNLNVDIYMNIPELCINYPRKECFVSHMMVWRKTIILEMLASFVSGTDSNSASEFDAQMGLEHLFRFGKSVVDWQLYADYILSNYPALVTRQKWSNIALYLDSNASDLIENFLNEYKCVYRSVSFHTHLLQ